ncbi:hypothetical protein RFI_28250 [Reticulomyxa filosa]|uniref:Uncharacterized protein n=1 Tax=Reticulomyxa filosa TaxID=46433 RepID=X6M579_RETFI|nr:hypothetical protein RFI_28250 [Reticulomyxa filosa]|eukprot:ETO09138.1 hypothetical protein RFI_28250 [Reticulomyxa filosa]
MTSKSTTPKAAGPANADSTMQEKNLQLLQAQPEPLVQSLPLGKNPSGNALESSGKKVLVEHMDQDDTLSTTVPLTPPSKNDNGDDDDEDFIEAEEAKDAEKDKENQDAIFFVSSIMSSLFENFPPAYQTQVIEQNCDPMVNTIFYQKSVNIITFEQEIEISKEYEQHSENTKIITEKIQSINHSGSNKKDAESRLLELSKSEEQTSGKTNKETALIQQCQAIIDGDNKVLDCLKAFDKFMKSLMLRYITIQTNLLFIIQLLLLYKEIQDLIDKTKRFPKFNPNILVIDSTEIKKSIIEEIKNYHKFNRQIPEGIINFTVSPVNIALSKEFAQIGTSLSTTDHPISQYQRTTKFKETKKCRLYMSINILKQLAKNPTPEMLQKYKENIFAAFEIQQWEKSFSEIEMFPQLLINFGEKPGSLPKRQTGFIDSEFRARSIPFTGKRHYPENLTDLPRFKKLNNKFCDYVKSRSAIDENSFLQDVCPLILENFFDPYAKVEANYFEGLLESHGMYFSFLKKKGDLQEPYKILLTCDIIYKKISSTTTTNYTKFLIEHVKIKNRLALQQKVNMHQLFKYEQIRQKKKPTTTFNYYY